jgi:3-dehydroquinate synthetase
LDRDPLRFVWSREGTASAVLLRQDVEDLSLTFPEGSSPYLVIDSNVDQHWGGLLREHLGIEKDRVSVLHAVEKNKTLGSLRSLCEEIQLAGVTRDDTVIAAGGGLTCDLAAMAASVWLRGVDLVLVPTTLLAMVDACLGGKTGVNLKDAKNQIGTVYPARLIAVATSFLRTLPDREYRNGLAEALKMSLIADRSIAGLLGPFNEYVEHLPLVRKCLEAKAGIIAGDLYDLGHRRRLNLGHTLGHALESVSGFGLSHGEAVGLGTVAAAHMAGCADLAAVVRELLERIGLPGSLRGPYVSIERIEAFLRRDKKTSRDGRTWVLPFGWEDCRLVKLNPADEQRLLQEALDFLLNG